MNGLALEMVKMGVNSWLDNVLQTSVVNQSSTNPVSSAQWRQYCWPKVVWEIWCKLNI